MPDSIYLVDLEAAIARIGFWEPSGDPADLTHALVDALKNIKSELAWHRHMITASFCPHCGSVSKHPAEAPDVCPTYEQFVADQGGSP